MRRASPPPRGPGLKALVFPQEDGRVGEAEAVDRLLHVPNVEQIVPVAGDGVENGVLDSVGVLVFVDQNLAVPVRDAPAQLRLPAGASAGQRRERKMLQVGIIQKGAAALFSGIGFVELPDQPEEASIAGNTAFRSESRGPLGTENSGSSFLSRFLQFFPDALHLRRQVRILGFRTALRTGRKRGTIPPARPSRTPRRRRRRPVLRWPPKSRARIFP
jgi:hypothetical protein